MAINSLKDLSAALQDINDVRDFIHAEAVGRGFYDKPKEIGTQLMLVVSELGEAVEADRKMRDADMVSFYQADATPEAFKEYVKDTLQDEIADAMIRLFDFCGANNIDIEEHIFAKLRYNQTREKRHGKAY